MTSRVLGAILAGGQARRFGSDKALVDVGGQAMLDRVAERLRPQCDRLVVVGRDWPALTRVEDAPRPGLGPLGGLAGALKHGQAHGFDAVLSCGCDLPDVPDDLITILSPGPSVIGGQPLLGLWPTAAADALMEHLTVKTDHSLRHWADCQKARRVKYASIPNINTRSDLATFLGSPQLHLAPSELPSDADQVRRADRRSSP